MAKLLMLSLHCAFLLLLTVLVQSQNPPYAGPGGYAGIFDGPSGSVLYSDNSLTLPTSFTLEAWMWMAGSLGGNDRAAVTLNDNGPGEADIQISRQSTDLRIRYEGSVVRIVQDIFVENVPIHVALVVTEVEDSNFYDFRLYVNGEDQGIGTVAKTSSSTYQLSVGGGNDANEWSGGIDSVRFWNGERSQAEIVAWMEVDDLDNPALIATYLWDSGSVDDFQGLGVRNFAFGTANSFGLIASPEGTEPDAFFKTQTGNPADAIAMSTNGPRAIEAGGSIEVTLLGGRIGDLDTSSGFILESFSPDELVVTFGPEGTEMLLGDVTASDSTSTDGDSRLLVTLSLPDGDYSSNNRASLSYRYSSGGEVSLISWFQTQIVPASQEDDEEDTPTTGLSAGEAIAIVASGIVGIGVLVFGAVAMSKRLSPGDEGAAAVKGGRNKPRDTIGEAIDGLLESFTIPELNLHVSSMLESGQVEAALAVALEVEEKAAGGPLKHYAAAVNNLEACLRALGDKEGLKEVKEVRRKTLSKVKGGDRGGRGDEEVLMGGGSPMTGPGLRKARNKAKKFRAQPKGKGDRALWDAETVRMSVRM